MADSYDLIVIGSGPGGYVAAIRAAQLGMKVACVEKRKALGGTCLNIGCIPSKALLQSTHLYHEAKHDLSAHGISTGEVGFDLKAMLKRKDDVVNGSTRGIDFLFKKNKITWLQGSASIVGAGQVSVAKDGGSAETYAAKNILIATGSESMPLPGVEIDEKQIVTSTGALELQSVPRHLAVIGGGYIGLEMGSVWRRLGSEVTVIEFMDRIVPGMDLEVGKHFQRLLGKQGFKFRLGTKVVGARKSANGVSLNMQAAAGGNEETLECDVVLLCIGRRPHVEGLGLDKAGIKLTERGRIAVDARFQTSVAGIYAIGDVIDGPMLAHKASEEAVVCVEMLAGQTGHIDHDKIPAVVYTQPEMASVGRTEEQLKQAGIAYKTGKYPFSADPRSRANNRTDGFVKIIADAKSDEVLGVHILGAEAGTMIAEATLAMAYRASAEDIARVVHAHPTVNEATKEAALAAWDKPIHI